MAQQRHVPKFGNWEGGENVPYTAYFDKARKGKSGGKMINPNDPQENPDAFLNENPPPRNPPIRTSSDYNTPTPIPVVSSKPKHEPHSSREELEVKRMTDPLPRHDVGARRPVADAPQRYPDRANSSDQPRGGSKYSGTPDRSFDQSPLHPNYQAKAASRGAVNSPSWERKGPSEASRGSHGYASSTPSKSRLRTARSEEMPEKGAAVPKFGDWDESNPSSADGYTHIFNRVREEKHTGGAAKVPVMPTESPFHSGQRKDKHQDYEKMNGCCFWFSRK